MIIIWSINTYLNILMNWNILVINKQSISNDELKLIIFLYWFKVRFLNINIYLIKKDNVQVLWRKMIMLK